MERIRVRLGKELYTRLRGYCAYCETELSTTFRRLIEENRAQIDGGKSAVEFLDANRVSTTGGSPEIAVPGMTARAYETPDYLRAIVHANRNRLRITPEQRRAKLDWDIARLDRLINTELDALARVPYIIEVKNEGLEK